MAQSVDDNSFVFMVMINWKYILLKTWELTGAAGLICRCYSRLVMVGNRRFFKFPWVNKGSSKLVFQIPAVGFPIFFALQIA